MLNVDIDHIMSLPASLPKPSPANYLSPPPPCKPQQPLHFDPQNLDDPFVVPADLCAKSYLNVDVIAEVVEVREAAISAISLAQIC